MQVLVTRSEASAARAARRRARRRRRITTFAGLLLVAAGVIVVVVALVAPEQAEGVYGAVKQTAQRTWDDTVQAAAVAIADGDPGPVRSVALGVAGGEAELDRCDGTFTRMVDYTAPETDIPPVWAAHNNCGGDVLLSWELGDRLTLTGPGASGASGQVFEVVEVRHAPRDGADLTALDGMSGDLIVQTCYYRPDTRMRFLALEPVSEDHQ